MLENEELIDEFKKSISSTVKSIGKSEEIEIEFIDGMPSISGKQVFLCSTQRVGLFLFAITTTHSPLYTKSTTLFFR